MAIFLFVGVGMAMFVSRHRSFMTLSHFYEEDVFLEEMCDKSRRPEEEIQEALLGSDLPGEALDCLPRSSDVCHMESSSKQCSIVVTDLCCFVLSSSLVSSCTQTWKRNWMCSSYHSVLLYLDVFYFALIVFNLSEVILDIIINDWKYITLCNFL